MIWCYYSHVLNCIPYCETHWNSRYRVKATLVTISHLSSSLDLHFTEWPQQLLTHLEQCNQDPVYIMHNSKGGIKNNPVLWLCTKWYYVHWEECYYKNHKVNFCISADFQLPWVLPIDHLHSAGGVVSRRLEWWGSFYHRSHRSPHGSTTQDLPYRVYPPLIPEMCHFPLEGQCCPMGFVSVPPELLPQTACYDYSVIYLFIYFIYFFFVCFWVHAHLLLVFVLFHALFFVYMSMLVLLFCSCF